VLRIGCNLDFSFRVRHHSGRYRWVHAKANPVENPDGTVREWVGSVEDVQARREGEDKLRVSEERLRLAIAAEGVVVWEYDVETDFITRSDNARELLGSGSGPAAEAVRWLHPEDAPRLKAALATTADTDADYRMDYRVLHPDGSTRWLRSSGRLLRDGHKGSDRIIGVTFDVTGQKQAELDLLATREHLSELVSRQEAMKQIAGGFVWEARADGKVDDIPEWRAFTGQSSNEVEGWGWLNAVHPSDRERIRESIHRHLGCRSGLTVEYRVRTKLGEYRWVHARSAPVARGERISGWIGVCQIVSGPSEASLGGISLVPPADTQALSGAQLRAARAILRWAVRDLAEASGVSASAIRRLEEEDGPAPTRDPRRLAELRSTLEEAGVQFLYTPDGKAGVAPM
jgi:PAS domain S-box-containing protein